MAGARPSDSLLPGSLDSDLMQGDATAAGAPWPLSGLCKHRGGLVQVLATLPAAGHVDEGLPGGVLLGDPALMGGAVAVWAVRTEVNRRHVLSLTGRRPSWNSPNDRGVRPY